MYIFINFNYIGLIESLQNQTTKNPQSSMNKESLKKQETGISPLSASQKVFKYICFVVVLILLFCVKGFIQFRSYCQSKKIYVFSEEMLQWCIGAFFLIFAIKYSYFYLMKDKIESIIHQKYEGEERRRKVKMVLKLSYDACFYTISSLTGYILFRHQYWFTAAAGGQGSCSAIYKDYPNWPSQKRVQLQKYFMVQLGVHAFSVFEMVVIKGRSQRKYYQFLLHHFVAVTLILFSMMSNQIAAGTMIVIVHDISDTFMSFSRGLMETRYARYRRMCDVLIAFTTFCWIYFRIFLFPFCLLANVYINKPIHSDEWYMIHFQYVYLFSMACLLVAMHIYWTYYLIKSILNSLNKKQYDNNHQNKKK